MLDIHMTPFSLLRFYFLIFGHKILPLFNTIQDDTEFHIFKILAHCGLVTPYDDTTPVQNNAVTPNRLSAVIWTNADPVVGYIQASPGPKMYIFGFYITIHISDIIELLICYYRVPGQFQSLFT